MPQPREQDTENTQLTAKTVPKLGARRKKTGGATQAIGSQGLGRRQNYSLKRVNPLHTSSVFDFFNTPTKPIRAFLP
jgi:hypothetical protein